MVKNFKLFGEITSCLVNYFCRSIFDIFIVELFTRNIDPTIFFNNNFIFLISKFD